MNKIVTVGVVLAAVLAMVGCEMSEGMEEAENRRAQASAMVVAGMKRLNVQTDCRFHGIQVGDSRQSGRSQGMCWMQTFDGEVRRREQ